MFRASLLLTASLLLSACGHAVPGATARAVVQPRVAALGTVYVMDASQSAPGHNHTITLALRDEANHLQSWKLVRTERIHTRLVWGSVAFTVDGVQQDAAQKQAAAELLAHALFGSRAVQLAIVQQAEDDLLHGDWMQNDETSGW